MSPLRKSEESSSSSLPATTPQMMILGMNSNDENVLTQRTNRRSGALASSPPASSSLTTTTNRSGSWLSRIISSGSSSAATLLTAGSSGDRDDEADHHHDGGAGPPQNAYYSAMGDESPQRLNPHLRHRLSPPEITSDMVYAALGPQLSPTSDAAGLGRSSSAPTTEHNDNSDKFFFRSTDGTTISPRRSSVLDHAGGGGGGDGGGVWKTLRRNTRHSELFEYSDAVETLPPPILQRYRTRYAQLNQDIVLPDDDDDEEYDYREAEQCIMFAHRDDLHLHEHDNAFSTIAQSNLVYEADGKRLMRLPRDRVRLLMDPDLEPGILSVEYEDNNNDDSTNRDVRYVLTIHEDLYRKIVMEMSPRYLQYDAKLDIRFAYLALAIILFLLLINTFAFHEA